MSLRVLAAPLSTTTSTDGVNNSTPSKRKLTNTNLEGRVQGVERAASAMVECVLLLTRSIVPFVVDSSLPDGLLIALSIDGMPTKDGLRTNVDRIKFQMVVPSQSYNPEMLCTITGRFKFGFWPKQVHQVCTRGTYSKVTKKGP